MDARSFTIRPVEGDETIGHGAAFEATGWRCTGCQEEFAGGAIPWHHTCPIKDQDAGRAS